MGVGYSLGDSSAETVSAQTIAMDSANQKDRDINAAINILHEGIRLLAIGTTESQNATGNGVNPAKPW